jgi:hypothetical protein
MFFLFCVQSMNLNVPERGIPPNLMREGAAVRILDSHSEVEYTKPPDYLQVVLPLLHSVACS